MLNPTIVLARLLQILNINPSKPSPSPPPLQPHSEPSTSTPNEATRAKSSKFALGKRGLPAQAIHSDPSLYTRQAACLLFAKLPIELRDAVWGYVVGHCTVHMYWHDRDTLRGFVCEMQQVGKRKCVSMAHEENRARELMWQSASHIDEEDIRQEKGFMPLLLTCRAIYFESTRVLYATSRFDFTDHWPTFQYLPWSIPLASINHITHINIVAHGVPLPSSPPKADFVSWTKLWETLPLFKSLRDLQVELVPTRGHRMDPPPTEAQLSEAANELLFPVQQMRELVLNGQGVKGRGRWVLKVPFRDKAGASVVVRDLESVGWNVKGV